MKLLRSTAAIALLGLACLDAGPASAVGEAEKRTLPCEERGQEAQQRTDDTPECPGYYAKCWWPDRKAIDAVINR